MDHRSRGGLDSSN